MPSAVRRGGGGLGTGRQRRRAGPGPGRRPGGAGRQGRLPPRQGVRRRGRPPGRRGARRPRAGRPRPDWRSGDMVVVGPTRRRCACRASRGAPTPGTAWPSPATGSTPGCADAALAAGAVPFLGRAARAPAHGAPTGPGRLLARRRRELRADVVIGADGAAEPGGRAGRGWSQPGGCCGGSRVRGVRSRSRSSSPRSCCGTSRTGRSPGTAGCSPGRTGRPTPGWASARVADRAGARRRRARLAPVRRAPRGTWAAASGRRPVGSAAGRVAQDGAGGTSPAAGRVLLVGDAAGLVNPLQGEGIAHAMTSALAAARRSSPAPARPRPATGPTSAPATAPTWARRHRSTPRCCPARGWSRPWPGR